MVRDGGASSLRLVVLPMVDDSAVLAYFLNDWASCRPVPVFRRIAAVVPSAMISIRQQDSQNQGSPLDLFEVRSMPDYFVVPMAVVFDPGPRRKVVMQRVARIESRNDGKEDNPSKTDGQR